MYLVETFTMYLVQSPKISLNRNPNPVCRSFVSLRSWCLKDAFDVEQQLLNGDVELELTATEVNVLDRTVVGEATLNNSDTSYDRIEHAVEVGVL